MVLIFSPIVQLKLGKILNKSIYLPINILIVLIINQSNFQITNIYKEKIIWKKQFILLLDLN